MISTIIKYFRFGGTNAPKLMRGMGWTLLTSFFESWQMMALAVVLSSLAANASAGPAGNADMGQTALPALVIHRGNLRGVPLQECMFLRRQLLHDRREAHAHR